MKKDSIKKHKKQLVKNAGARALLARMLKCQGMRDVVKASLFASERGIWRGVVATPPSSILEVTVAEFMKSTPVAAELPFMSVVSLVAQMMCEKGAALVMNSGQRILPDLYTVMLASSGELKSFTVDGIMNAFGRGGWKPNSISDPGSTAGLLEGLSKNSGRASFLWLEEFGEFWLQTEKEAHEQTPRMLLMCYDHKKLSKQLKNSLVEVETPCLSILGTTVTENLHKQLSEEDWRSGLCQRISFVHCPPDPMRPSSDRKYAILDGMNFDRIADSFREALTTPVHPDYHFSPSARTGIGDAWVMMGQQGVTMDFVRRIEYRMFKYSLIYHWILGKTNNVIDREDVAWATRLAMLHLADLRNIMDSVEFGELQQLLVKAEKLQRRFGAELTPRKLFMYMHRALRSMEAATELHSMLVEQQEKAAKVEAAIKQLTDNDMKEVTQ